MTCSHSETGDRKWRLLPVQAQQSQQVKEPPGLSRYSTNGNSLRHSFHSFIWVSFFDFLQWPWSFAMFSSWCTFPATAACHSPWSSGIPKDIRQGLSMVWLCTTLQCKSRIRGNQLGSGDWPKISGKMQKWSQALSAGDYSWREKAFSHYFSTKARWHWLLEHPWSVSNMFRAWFVLLGIRSHFPKYNLSLSKLKLIFLI